MISIKIISVGKIKDKNLSSLINEYTKRITKYAKIDIIEVEDEKIPHNPSDSEVCLIKEKESNKVLNKVNCINKPYIIALDLKGSSLSSIQFSKQIEDIVVNGFSTIVFLIGGSLGMSDKLLNICNKKICFSLLTFPHQLIRLFLLEQIFRAFKIINNETYHH